jgi:hypothetical protein
LLPGLWRCPRAAVTTTIPAARAARALPLARARAVDQQLLAPPAALAAQLVKAGLVRPELHQPRKLAIG